MLIDNTKLSLLVIIVGHIIPQKLIVEKLGLVYSASIVIARS